jgi:Protein of unknown function (DUF4054)
MATVKAKVVVVVEYNDENFRLMFPAFADETTWPEALLQTYWDLGGEFISTTDSPCHGLNGASLQYARDLMCAHIATLMAVPPEDASGAGGATGGGVVSSASIGAVSVSMMQPPAKGMWDFWFAQTPYGQQLLALLAIKGVGGLYIGGLPERLGFRKVGGVFF